MQLNFGTVSTWVAGLVTVLVGFTSSAVLVVTAASQLGATQAQIASWLLIMSLGMSAGCLWFSWHYRQPITIAWSTPGAAMMIASSVKASLGEAVAAFMVCGVLTMLAGYSGLFERSLKRIPQSLATALLAGVLLRFGVDTFAGFAQAPLLIGIMLLSFFAMKKWNARYAVPVALLVGIALIAPETAWQKVELSLARLTWVSPSWNTQVIIGLGLPLFIITMCSQNLTGYAVMQANGYRIALSPLVGHTGLFTTLAAPLGCFSLNLAAISAAVCAGAEAHPDPHKRYQAAMAAGVFYFLVGLAGFAVVSVLAVFPKAFIVCIAGLALLSTIASSLARAMENSEERDAALVTFLCAASGLTLFGIGSAFWGLVAGGLVYWGLKQGTVQ
ncbi:MAG: hypothetical protein RLZZ502_1687 [Pseudomonadota bacterium]|jgi:benzoate membrane transport protein